MRKMTPALAAALSFTDAANPGNSATDGFVRNILAAYRQSPEEVEAFQCDWCRCQNEHPQPCHCENDE